jgi:hypothetical protein
VRASVGVVRKRSENPFINFSCLTMWAGKYYRPLWGVEVWRGEYFLIVHGEKYQSLIQQSAMVGSARMGTAVMYSVPAATMAVETFRATSSDWLLSHSITISS